jgi:hypothetical protein
MGTINNAIDLIDFLMVVVVFPNAHAAFQSPY